MISIGKKRSKIKVCIIGFHAYPIFNPKSNNDFGGAEVQLTNLARKLAENPEFEVSFVVNEPGLEPVSSIDKVTIYNYYKKPGKKKTLSQKIKNFNIAGSIRLVGRIFTPAKAYFLYSYMKLLRKVDADIYIQRCASTITGGTALFSRIFKKKFIFMSAHEFDSDLKCVNILDSFEKMVYRYGLKNADLVVVQNKKQQKNMLKTFGKKSVVIRSMHCIKKPRPAKKESILWVARLEKWKQPEFFLELAKKFPNEKFVMVAPKATGNPSYGERIGREAGKIKNLQFIEKVPFDEINDYFAKAKIFVNTSSYEGFPNTFIQAWIAKTPVLSLNVDPDEILCNKGLGFHSKNLEQMKKDIRRLLKSGKQRRKLADSSYKYIKENHDIERIIPDYYRLFKTLENK